MTDPTTPVMPRPAASLLVLRQGDGPEVLMGLRGAGHRFMPNRLVFPGGAVDEEDHRAAAAAEPADAVLALLVRAAGGSLGRALAVAAARELREETGLSLGEPPALDGLDYLCRAITPAISPVRFDARFLVVDAGRVRGTLAGSGELEDLRWYSVREALALDLALVTRGVLERLLDWLAMSAAERAGRPGVPLLLDKVWVLED